MKKWIWGVFIGFCGAVVGFVNGFMGAGGGMLLVPILCKICKVETKKAHATAVLIILPICLISGVCYIINQGIDIKLVLTVGIGSIVGGILGTFVLKKLKTEVIEVIFYLIMIASGIKMLV